MHGGLIRLNQPTNSQQPLKTSRLRNSDGNPLGSPPSLGTLYYHSINFPLQEINFSYNRTPTTVAMFSLSLETEAAEHAVSEPGPFTQNAPVQILAQALTSSLILSE